MSAAEATPLAVIQQTSTVYVNFTQSTAEVLRLRQGLAANRVEHTGDASTEVRVVLEDGTELARPGRLLFTDLSVDTTSGQVTLRQAQGKRRARRHRKVNTAHRGRQPVTVATAR